MKTITVLFLVSLFIWSCQKEETQPVVNDTKIEFDTAEYLDCNTMATNAFLEIHNDTLSEKLIDNSVSFDGEKYSLWIFYKTRTRNRNYYNSEILPDSIMYAKLEDIGEIKITPLFCHDVIIIE